MDGKFLESLAKFWAIVQESWSQNIWGLGIDSIAYAMGVLLVALALRGVFTRFVLNRLIGVASRTHNTLDDKLIDALEGPIRFIPVVVGIYAAMEISGISSLPRFVDVSDNLIRSLVVLNLFWVLFCLVDPLSFLLGKLEEIFSSEMVYFIVKVFKGLVIGLGVATVLELWGIEVGPIIAGFGLVGVAVALGAQDLFKNLISGFLILAEKRFKAGDWVLVSGIVEGTVENIGFRSTMIRRFDKAPTIVPNAVFADKAVTNFSEMTYRRIYWKIGVEYSTTVSQLQEITDNIRDYLTDNEDFAQPPEATLFVVTDSFNDSSIDIMIYCFTKTTAWGEWLTIKQDFAYAIKSIVENAGSGFAFPSLTVYAGTGADEPEPFVPPKDKHDANVVMGDHIASEGEST